MGVYLRAKFEVSSVILTSFRQGVIPPHTPPISKRTPKKATEIRVKLASLSLDNKWNKYTILLIKENSIMDFQERK